MQVLVKGGHKAPWKYLDSIGVEELSFGLVPPTLQVASAKFEPSTSMLTLSMDVRFTSSSAQAVVSTAGDSSRMQAALARAHDPKPTCPGATCSCTLHPIHHPSILGALLHAQQPA